MQNKFTREYQTLLHVRRMILILQEFQGFAKGRTRFNNMNREKYEKFRRSKRKIYELYKEDPEKARNIVRYAMHKAGWS